MADEAARQTCFIPVTNAAFGIVYRTWVEEARPLPSWLIAISLHSTLQGLSLCNLCAVYLPQCPLDK